MANLFWDVAGQSIVSRKLKEEYQKAERNGVQQKSMIPHFSPRFLLPWVEYNYENALGLVDMVKVEAYFHELHYRYYTRGRNRTEQDFAAWHISRLPNAVGLCFGSFYTSFRSFTAPDSKGNQLDAIVREHYVKNLKLLLAQCQFELVNYLLARMTADCDESASNAVELLDGGEAKLRQPGGEPVSGQKSNLYAVILDKLSIRPLLCFINNYDVLPPRAWALIRNSVYQTLWYRSNGPSGDLHQFVEHTELKDRRALFSALKIRKSLLDAIWGSDATADLFDENPRG